MTIWFTQNHVDGYIFFIHISKDSFFISNLIVFLFVQLFVIENFKRVSLSLLNITIFIQWKVVVLHYNIKDG